MIATKRPGQMLGPLLLLAWDSGQGPVVTLLVPSDEGDCGATVSAMKTPLVRVIVFVFDVQACAQFYVDVFGFTRLEAEDPAGWQELETGGCRLAFHKARGVDGPTGSEDHPHKIVFFAEDVALVRERAVARGAVMGTVKTFGTLTMCDGRDIEGHVFQVSNRG